MSTLISVVTPSYNQGNFIQSTLDSVLKQDYPDVEHIVMDGGSTDGTIHVLENYGDPRLKWKSEPDNGQADAINKGMRVATGEILAYLNSDDIYLPGTLAFVSKYFESHPECDVLHGDCLSIGADGEEIAPMLQGSPYNLRDAFTKRWHMPQPAVFWRKRVTETIGLFDESLHYALDYDYWLRMIIAGCYPIYVARPLAGFRFHEDSKTISQSAAFLEDWKIVLDKVYSTPDLDVNIARLKPLSYAYIAFHGADTFWKRGQRKEARPYLRQVLRSGGPLRLKVMAFMMLVDSYFRTSFSDYLQQIYFRAKDASLEKA
jgi:glycosyltransferase involved in cell wall biosynthesis